MGAITHTHRERSALNSAENTLHGSSPPYVQIRRKSKTGFAELKCLLDTFYERAKEVKELRVP